MENIMETTIVCWGYIGIMEKKMETTMVSWGYIGIMGTRIGFKRDKRNTRKCPAMQWKTKRIESPLKQFSYSASKRDCEFPRWPHEALF